MKLKLFVFILIFSVYSLRGQLSLGAGLDGGWPFLETAEVVDQRLALGYFVELEGYLNQEVSLSLAYIQNILLLSHDSGFLGGLNNAYMFYGTRYFGSNKIKPFLSTGMGYATMDEVSDASFGLSLVKKSEKIVYYLAGGVKWNILEVKAKYIAPFDREGDYNISTLTIDIGLKFNIIKPKSKKVKEEKLKEQIKHIENEQIERELVPKRKRLERKRRKKNIKDEYYWDLK